MVPTPAFTRPAPLDRPVLVSNLASGVLWLLLLAAFGGWPLSLIGAVYVTTGSLFLAAVYAQETLTRRREALAWIAPWLVAVALWTWIGSNIASGDSVSSYLPGLYFGLILATTSYLAWQVAALAIRRFLAGQDRPRSSSR